MAPKLNILKKPRKRNFTFDAMPEENYIINSGSVRTSDQWWAK
jgi:hypothetical protein